MTQSVKINYILNLINTGSQMIFPLITFPYACRILEADGIGKVNFFTSIIGYISLLTCLGIPMYAIREIAKDRNYVIKMNQTTVEILLLHTILTLIGYIIVAILCISIPEIKADLSLFLVLSLTIFFTAIGCEWFYQGIEDFKYITIRGLIIKSIAIILLFLLVKTKDDLIYYGWYTVIGILGGNIFNFFRLRKYIHRKNIIFTDLNIIKHLKPAIQVFSLNVVISIYIQLNPVLLGFIKGTLAVGFFTAATKVMMMITRLSSCLGAVVMPRVSHLLAENKEVEFKSLIQKSYDFTIAIALPLTIWMIFSAPYIIHILCGTEFYPSVLTSQIIAPVILLVGISNVMGIQVLYPKGRIQVVIRCCLIGAITDLVLSLILIPFLSYNGVAIAYLCAEISTTLSMCIIAKKDLPITYWRKNHFLYLLGALVMAITILLTAKYINASTIIIFIIQGVVGFMSYFLFLLFMKEEFMQYLISKLKGNICK